MKELKAQMGMLALQNNQILQLVAACDCWSTLSVHFRNLSLRPLAPAALSSQATFISRFFGG